MSKIGTPRGVRRDWRRCALGLDAAGKLLREMGYVMSQNDPVEAVAWLDRGGSLRRVEGRYADGGDASLRMDGRGRAVLNQSLSISTTFRKSAAK